MGLVHSGLTVHVLGGTLESLGSIAVQSHCACSEWVTSDVTLHTHSHMHTHVHTFTYTVEFCVHA